MSCHLDHVCTQCHLPLEIDNVDFDIGRSYCNYWGAVKKDCTWLQTDLQARKEMELHKVLHIAPNVGQAPGFFCCY